MRQLCYRSVPACLLACLPACLLACFRCCLPACPPGCFHACLLAFLVCLLSFLPACCLLLACLPDLLAFLLAYLFACLLSGLLASLLPCLLAVFVLWFIACSWGWQDDEEDAAEERHAQPPQDLLECYERKGWQVYQAVSALRPGLGMHSISPHILNWNKKKKRIHHLTFKSKDNLCQNENYTNIEIEMMLKQVKTHNDKHPNKNREARWELKWWWNSHIDRICFQSNILKIQEHNWQPKALHPRVNITLWRHFENR